MRLQEIFKAITQFVKEIQAGGPVQKATDAQPEPDKPTARTAANVTSASSSAPSQVLHPSLTFNFCYAGTCSPCTSAVLIAGNLGLALLWLQALQQNKLPLA